MSDINDLLTLIQNSIDLSNQLTQGSGDNFSQAAASLEDIKLLLLSSNDRSSECRCNCHSQGEDWHTLPCGCYSGNPVL